MRISLLYNPDAGGAMPFAELKTALKNAGYDVVRKVGKGSSRERLLEKPVDFVVAAGGDGTIRKAASTIAGSGVPLAILPLGTANNIAKSLGANGSMEQALERWKSPRRVPFDFGLVRGLGKDRRFLESVGTGLVSAGIANAKVGTPDADEKADAALERAIRTYREALSGLRPQPWSGTIDDEQVEGELLLLEVLNIPSVGPNLVLSERASPSDGAFEVVMAGESQREALAAYLEALAGGDHRPPALPSRRARRVEIHSSASVHVDDKVRANDDVRRLTIEMEEAAVTVLV